MLKPVEKPIKFIKNSLTKGKSYPITHVSAVIDNNGESIKSTIDSLKNKSSVTKVTWQELKDKRDAGKLTPGALYRITDYNCTTTQENTRSAGHQFDIVLLALSANKLAEEGWAMMHDNVYDVTFTDGVTKKCYLYKISDYDYNIVVVETMLGIDADVSTIIINEDNKTATWDEPYNTTGWQGGFDYNYFQNSNLSAWKVWYCLDNDTSRFAWADDNAPQIYSDDDEIWLERDITKDRDNRFAWYNGDDDVTYYTDSMMPKVGEQTYVFVQKWSSGAVVKNVKGFGRGVIYRLIDEWNNDVAYDFKNIQYVRKLTNGSYDPDTGTDTWVYTFTGWDEDNVVVYDMSLTFENANNNFVGSPFPDSFALSDVVFIGDSNSSSSSSSSGCTINSTQVRLVACEGAIINAATSDYLFCDDTLVTTNADDPAIYINNKKVLTES